MLKLKQNWKFKCTFFTWIYYLIKLLTFAILFDVGLHDNLE